METEKKQGKKKVNRTLVARILKGNTAYLVLGAVFLLVAVMAAYCGPLVTSFTVDYVIDSKESNLPGWVMGWIEHWAAGSSCAEKSGSVRSRSSHAHS